MKELLLALVTGLDLLDQMINRMDAEDMEVRPCFYWLQRALLCVRDTVESPVPIGDLMRRTRHIMEEGARMLGASWSGEVETWWDHSIVPRLVIDTMQRTPSGFESYTVLPLGRLYSPDFVEAITELRADELPWEAGVGATVLVPVAIFRDYVESCCLESATFLEQELDVLALLYPELYLDITLSV